VIQLVELAKRVLIIALYYSEANSPRAALNDGQYKYKKVVPTIAMTFE